MSSITLMPGNAHFVREIEDCFVYKFENRKRTQIAEGSCQIYQTSMQDETAHQDKHYYLRVGDFFQSLSKQQTLIRLTYSSSVCYLLKGQDFWICMSFAKGALGLQQFGKDLGFFLNVIDFSSELIDPSLREDIMKHCPETIALEDISSDAKKIIRKVGTSIGYIAGKASQILQNPTTQSTMSALSERANRFSEENISDNAKSTWNSIKKTSQSINNAMTIMVAPIVGLFNNLSSSLGENFYKSQNQYVKTFREYSLAIGDSLNQGQRKGHEIAEQAKSPEHEVLRQQVSAIKLR